MPLPRPEVRSRIPQNHSIAPGAGMGCPVNPATVEGWAPDPNEDNECELWDRDRVSLLEELRQQETSLK